MNVRGSHEGLSIRPPVRTARPLSLRVEMTALFKLTTLLPARVNFTLEQDAADLLNSVRTKAGT